MDWQGRRQSTNVEQGDPNAPITPVNPAKTVQNIQDNRDVANQLGGSAIDKIWKKHDWMQRSRRGNLDDPAMMAQGGIVPTNHVNKGYSRLKG